MVRSLEGRSCLICGHVDYGPDFRPLELTVADTKLAEGPEAQNKRRRRSAYRRNDHAGDFVSWPL